LEVEKKCGAELRLGDDVVVVVVVGFFALDDYKGVYVGRLKEIESKLN